MPQPVRPGVSWVPSQVNSRCTMSVAAPSDAPAVRLSAQPSVPSAKPATSADATAPAPFSIAINNSSHGCASERESPRGRAFREGTAPPPVHGPGLPERPEPRVPAERWRARVPRVHGCVHVTVAAERPSRLPQAPPPRATHRSCSASGSAVDGVDWARRLRAHTSAPLLVGCSAKDRSGALPCPALRRSASPHAPIVLPLERPGGDRRAVASHRPGGRDAPAGATGTAATGSNRASAARWTRGVPARLPPRRLVAPRWNGTIRCKRTLAGRVAVRGMGLVAASGTRSLHVDVGQPRAQ